MEAQGQAAASSGNSMRNRSLAEQRERAMVTIIITRTFVLWK